MRIRKVDHGPVTVLHLEGMMSGGSDRETLGQAFEQLIADRRLLAVLDFWHVNFLGSPAIGYLARNYAYYVRAGGFCVVARVSRRVALPLDLFLRQLFEVYDDVDEAVQALRDDEDGDLHGARRRSDLRVGPSESGPVETRA